LLRTAALTITELLQAIRTRRSRLPSRQAAQKLLAAYATQPGTDVGLLVWLTLLAAARGGNELDDVLRDFLKKPTRRVFPFAVFS